MRELTEDEVSAIQETRLAEWADQGERWFTFEHAAGWREIVRQFLGAVQSHGMSDASRCEREEGLDIGADG